MREVKFGLLKHQMEFLNDREHKFLALCGGYGCGKTVSLALKAIDLMLHNPGCPGLVFSPTMTLAQDIIMPQLDEFLNNFGFSFSLRKTPLPKYTIRVNGSESYMYVLSFENWRRIISYNAAWAIIDELDTVPLDIAQRAWKLLLGRIRVGKVRQIATASTPEGFRFLYQNWVVNSNSKAKRLIRAKSTDNPYLPEDFIQSMYDEYPKELVEAYINGEFVNLTGNVVYYCYNRWENSSGELYVPGEVVHVGMDFNVGRMAAVAVVQRGAEFHAVREFLNIRDTPDMIAVLKSELGATPLHRIIVHPDASGGSRKTVDASLSDISLLKSSGFTVANTSVNPYVRDRVICTNTGLRNGKGVRKVFINSVTCPELASAIEKLPYNQKGEVDKSLGIDHICDAFTYAIFNLLPLKTVAQYRQSRYVI